MSEKKPVYTYTITRLRDGEQESSIVVFDKYGSSVFTRACDDESLWFDEKSGGNLTDFFDALFTCNEAKLALYLDEDKKSLDEELVEVGFELDSEDEVELQKRAKEKGVDVVTYINEYFIKDFDDRVIGMISDTFEDRLARKLVVADTNRKLKPNDEVNKNKD